jgi:hypothetical protein
MYAKIRHYDLTGDALDELLRAGRALATRLSQVPGFVSYAALDGGAGVLASVSVFESEADLLAADRLIAAWEAEHRGALQPRPPQVTGGEVVVQRGL